MAKAMTVGMITRPKPTFRLERIMQSPHVFVILGFRDLSDNNREA
jgi:hypothetical protein